jgi:hypothetical protein
MLNGDLDCNDKLLNFTNIIDVIFISSLLLRHVPGPNLSVSVSLGPSRSRLVPVSVVSVSACPNLKLCRLGSVSILVILVYSDQDRY